VDIRFSINLVPSVVFNCLLGVSKEKEKMGKNGKFILSLKK